MRHHFLLAAVATGAVVAGNASAQVVFQDNFDAQPDGDTASVWQGGTPNDPGGGDADPNSPAVGSWGPIVENAPWYAQVSTATNGPTTGPAGGTGKYLTTMRNNEAAPTDVRGAFATAGTNLVSMDFQLKMSQGDMQYFVRGTNGGAFNPFTFSFLPVYVNFTLDGNVSVNGTVSPGVFDPASGYQSVHLDYNIPAQTVSVSVNGVTAPGMTNRPFIEPVTTLNQFSFYVIDTGIAGWDNVSASLLPLYWDTNGAVAGAGGASPGGTWDGTTTNFNADPAGGAAGPALTAMTAGDTIVFGAGTDATGAYTVNVSGTRTAGRINVEEGNLTLAGGTLAVGAFDVSAGASGTVSSVVSGGATGGAVTKSGAGTLTLAAANTHAGGTTVTGGTLVLANADALGTGGLTVNNGTAKAQAGLTKAVSVATVTTTGTGKLDMTDNDLVIKTSTLAAVQAQITAGFNGGTWDGPGINSSAAATHPNATTALGYGDNAELGLTTFSGVALTGAEILVKYTYYGDADLTGVVDLDDFGLFLTGYQNTSLPRTWIYGDFDYTGVIDLDDFGLFLYGYQNQGGPLSALSEAISGASGISSADRAAMQAAIAAVPEPASVGILALMGLGLARRSRKSRR